MSHEDGTIITNQVYLRFLYVQLNVSHEPVGQTVESPGEANVAILAIFFDRHHSVCVPYWLIGKIDRPLLRITVDATETLTSSNSIGWANICCSLLL